MSSSSFAEARGVLSVEERLWCRQGYQDFGLATTGLANLLTGWDMHMRAFDPSQERRFTNPAEFWRHYHIREAVLA